MDDAAKVLENRLRRAVARQGYTLRKSRRRDPRALDFGLYAIGDPARGMLLVDFRMTLADVESWVNRP
jgi:hypothetical protein